MTKGIRNLSVRQLANEANGEDRDAILSNEKRLTNGRAMQPHRINIGPHAPMVMEIATDTTSVSIMLPTPAKETVYESCLNPLFRAPATTRRVKSCKSNACKLHNRVAKYEQCT